MCEFDIILCDFANSAHHGVNIAQIGVVCCQARLYGLQRAVHIGYNIGAQTYIYLNYTAADLCQHIRQQEGLNIIAYLGNHSANHGHYSVVSCFYFERNKVLKEENKIIK